MTKNKWLTSILGLVTAMVFQVAVGMVLVFFLSVLFSSIDVYQPMGWIVSFASIWLCFTIAIALVGWIYLRIVHSRERNSFPVRFLLATLGTLLPMIALLVLGLRTGLVNRLEFTSVILNNWQPRLVSISLALGLLGFYLPGWVVTREARSQENAG
jgi:hypothetical protein